MPYMVESNGFEAVPIGFFQLLLPVINFRFHALRPNAKFFRELLLFGSQLLQGDELGYVFDAINDVQKLAVFPKNGGIYWAPISNLKSPAFRCGFADVVLLHRHGIRDAMEKNPVQ